MVAHAVAAVQVDIEGAEVPYLDDGERAEHIGEEHTSRDEAALGMAQQRVVAPDYVYKDKVVDQLEILDLFLFFLF